MLCWLHGFVAAIRIDRKVGEDKDDHVAEDALVDRRGREHSCDSSWVAFGAIGSVKEGTEACCKRTSGMYVASA